MGRDPREGTVAAVIAGRPEQVLHVGTTHIADHADTGAYVDMIKAGIVEPTNVTRPALQNAASTAALFLTTEVLVADKP